jgi:putative oxidoreductase
MNRAGAVSAGQGGSRGLNIALWAVQLLLAAAFGYSGYSKAFLPLSDLAPMMPWTASAAPWMVRGIGIAELAGAIGVILPALTRIRPGLTAAAAAGLVLLMICAAIFHLIQGEFAMTGVTLALGALAAFVLWGRTGRAPITPR